MFFNKIINKLSIKNFLILSLLISSIGISQNSKANFFVEKKLSFNTKAIQSFILVAASTAAVYIAIKCLFAAKRGGPQADALDRFRRNGQNIDLLSEEALNQYNNNTLFPSSRSLYSDFPLQHLADSATSNKRYLKYALGFFSDEYKTLGNRLETGLNTLKNNQRFKQDKKEFNHEYREENYRNTRTRDINLTSADKTLNIFQKIKSLFFTR